MSAAHQASNQDDYATAELQYKEALKEAEKSSGVNLLVLSVLESLGFMYVTAKRYEDAEAVFQKQVALAESRQDKDSQRLLLALIDQSYGYVADGKLDGAEAVNQKALKIAQEAGQGQSPLAEMIRAMQEGIRGKRKPK